MKPIRSGVSPTTLKVIALGSAAVNAGGEAKAIIAAVARDVGETPSRVKSILRRFEILEAP